MKKTTIVKMLLLAVISIVAGLGMSHDKTMYYSVFILASMTAFIVFLLLLIVVELVISVKDKEKFAFVSINKMLRLGYFQVVAYTMCLVIGFMTVKIGLIEGGRDDALVNSNNEIIEYLDRDRVFWNKYLDKNDLTLFRGKKREIKVFMFGPLLLTADRKLRNIKYEITLQVLGDRKLLENYLKKYVTMENEIEYAENILYELNEQKFNSFEKLYNPIRQRKAFLEFVKTVAGKEFESIGMIVIDASFKI